MSRSTSTTNRHRLSRRSFLCTGAALFGGALTRSLSAGATVQNAPRITATDLNGLSLLQGAGCNVVAMRGDNGALMVDGGLAANADALLRAVLSATGNNRIQMLINTHWHPEQTGCNEIVGREGGVILAHEKTKVFLSRPSVTFEGSHKALAEPGRPSQTVRLDGSLEFSGKKINYGYMPQAHTDGDIYIHFPDANVVAAGGVVSGEKWPTLDYRNGAWFGGRVRALQHLADIVHPDTRVVPADGRLITGRDILHQRDIYNELFTTMIAYMNMGLGAEDVVKRNPLSNYQSELGDPSVFLDQAYRSMQIAYVPD